MVINNQGAIGQGMLSGGTITGSQNAAQQSAAYNAMLQNAAIAPNPHTITAATGWRDFGKDYERSRASVTINVERASNGYIIRAEGSSVVAMTLEEVQQHVTAIVVSNLVLDGVK